jgi:cation diffusion facilitator CzcD-associated flavoprotein CzcO
MSDADVIIVGAGPAGLACAAQLAGHGLTTLLLEKAETVGAVWRRHYDRLHLHTDRGHSALPGLPMPRTYPRYPSRDQVVAYLENYATHFGLAPMFRCEVRTLHREAGLWHAETTAGGHAAPMVVVATGWADAPHRPSWPDEHHFRGRVLHSSEYHDPAPYLGQRALVVGFGNSGGEIALDLAEAGVDVTLAVRRPVCLLPRELLGVPILTWAIGQAWLPPRLADALNAPAIRLTLGPTRGLGLTIARKGPRRMIAEDRRVPLLDVGTLDKIRQGAIRVRGGIEHFTPEGVTFAGPDGTGRSEPFDVVILATGFHADLRALLPQAADTLDHCGIPLATGRPTQAPGLFYCGQIPSPTGQLREIGIEARRIARLANRMTAAVPVD